jgi:hypothetical protein
MYKIFNFISIIKWIGFVGIFGLITGNQVLYLFFLFFLLGFVEIFRNLPVFFQSLHQAFAIPLIYMKHRFNLPSKENYICKTDFMLPFEGQWLTINGGTDRKASHSWILPTQRYAYDFLIMDKNENTHSGDNKVLENYYCYGQDILAPADGEIVKLMIKHPNSSVFGNGSAECKAHDIRGNYITIKHNENEYSTIAHIKPNSITVKKGQKVTQGQIIARCGNSGNTSEPHVHFQVSNGKSFFTSAGLPIRFKNVIVTKNGESHPAEYISKGQFVQNGE